MVLDILETAKWTLSTQQQQQQQLQQKNHPQAYPSRCTLTRSRTKARPKSSAISSSKDFEDGPAVRLMPPDSLRRAEWLAQQLVMEFKRNWLPSHKPQRGRRSLRSSLQELPGTGGMSPSGGCLRDGMKLRTCRSGSVSWTPPRFQLILQIQPTLRRSEVMALQNYLCAGCGTEVEPKYIKKLLYCTYLNRYFCECCHSSSEAVIPARVLANWDFGRFPVSDFSKHLLDSVWHQPLFDLSCLVETLRVKELEKLSVR
ncbi:protein RUBCNL-like [Cynoglossus semilaevis]|uniref:protein RUBCNL-like n=1 Tax=Cynoglossus semilaevis TaxID=244447 RepID=UPI000D6281F9|nr:protein RUBCNL-like [Cynoglossus semilaevis]